MGRYSFARASGLRTDTKNNNQSYDERHMDDEQMTRSLTW